MGHGVAQARDDDEELWNRLRAGDPAAFDAVFQMLCGELRRLAHRKRRGFPRKDSPSTTSLLNDLYVKLASPLKSEPGKEGWRDRQHFFAVAGRALFHVLLQRWRDRRAAKRGGGASAVPLDSVLDELVEELERNWSDPEALREALEQLEREGHAAHRRLLEAHFFAGLPLDVIAADLGLSEQRVRGMFEFARLWLFRRLERG